MGNLIVVICDATWQQGSGSTLAQVMACCLTAPSHYLNQCWLIIKDVLWHGLPVRLQSRMCCYACQDRQPGVSLEVSGSENVPRISCACATHNFTYLVRGPFTWEQFHKKFSWTQSIACVWIHTPFKIITHLSGVNELIYQLCFSQHLINIPWNMP